MEIKIHDIVLNPYYVERDKGLFLNVKVSYDDFYTILNLAYETRYKDKYINATIEGTEEEIRFGMFGYSKHDDFVKMKLTFVPKEVDEEEPRVVYLSTAVNEKFQDYIIELRMINNKLLNILADNNLISNLEKDEIVSFNEKEFYDTEMKFHEFKDIDNINS